MIDPDAPGSGERSPVRVLITGSRRWTDRTAIENALLDVTRGLPPNRITIVHGACPYGGADTLAEAVAVSRGWAVEPHPAAWTVHGKAAGPIRNQQMVDLGAEVCLAFPDPASRGTWDCVRRAEKAGIPVSVDFTCIAAPANPQRLVRDGAGNLMRVAWSSCTRPQPSEGEHR